MDDGDEASFSSLEEFEFDVRLKNMLQEKWGINSLFPPQAEALPNTLKGRNLMLAVPTASGKSLVAHITLANRLIGDLSGQRGILSLIHI